MHWTPLYKKHDGKMSTTNMLYAPMVNQDKTVMCMDWGLDNPYHHRINRNIDTVDFFFKREIKYRELFKNFEWMPKPINVDGTKIYMEWSPDTCNNILFIQDKKMIDLCPDWKDQLLQIIQDIKNTGYYKMALYPHCFFVKEGKLKTFDFYSCVEIDNPYIERNKIESIIGPDSGNRFNSATSDGLIDFSVFFKNTLTNHLQNYWPDNPFPEIYRRVYG